jgi:hypothetical protein
MRETVELGSIKLMGFIGLAAGDTSAIAMPWVVLAYAGDSSLGGVAKTILCIIGIAGGVILVIVAAFFPLVISNKVPENREGREDT